MIYKVPLNVNVEVEVKADNLDEAFEKVKKSGLLERSNLKEAIKQGSADIWGTELNKSTYITQFDDDYKNIKIISNF